jgi:hypothetical protein
VHLSKEENVLNLLRGRLWHTTSPERYQMIMETGSILPNPPIPEQEKWSAFRGAEFYPYVRSLGGVSLFDFEEFNHKSYSTNYFQSNWREFVPFRRTWRQSVWIEINRQKIADAFISGEMLLAKWKLDAAYHHSIMPIIEAAHIGPISLDAFICVFRCGDEIKDFEMLT